MTFFLNLAGDIVYKSKGFSQIFTIANGIILKADLGGETREEKLRQVLDFIRDFIKVGKWNPDRIVAVSVY